MEISEQLHCLFSAEVERRDGSYVVEIPKRELELGEIIDGSTYRIAISSSRATSTNERDTDETDAEKPKTDGTGNDRNRERSALEPPVEHGETRSVEIEDIGEQGDGITRVERGYVVIVPDTEMGERVRIEITDVQKNVAFADVVERLSYYE